LCGNNFSETEAIACSQKMSHKYHSALKFIQPSIYRALIRYLALAMLAFSVCRVAFYLFNTDFFPAMTFARAAKIMWGGLRFDLSAVLYLNSLLIVLIIIPLKLRFDQLYVLTIRWLFIIINSLAILANLADCIYYRFTLRRTTLSLISQFKNENNILLLIAQFCLDYWYILVLWVALVVLLVWLAKKIRFSGPTIQNPWIFYSSGIVAVPLVLYLFMGGARGGFAHSTRPITLSNAAAYATESKDLNIVLNTPFALMRTASTSIIERANYFSSEEELKKVFDPVVIPTDSLPFTNQNVVILILESFSKEFVGRYNRQIGIRNYQGYTPFLDSLIGVSRAYQFSFANGRKSIDAMPSVLASIPSIEVPYVLSHYSGNEINGLGNLLRKKDYHTAFFHGAPNGSMGFDAFANTAGFSEYYGKDEYDNDDDYDGIWGIWDDKFLQYVAGTLNNFQQPFFTSVFTVSSHHPYILPKEFDHKFSGSKDIYRTIEYTDYSLRKFFASASKMPWYENTLFVITADHASAEIEYPEYNTTWGYFAIPIFFFKPGSDWHSMQPEIIQQVDIMPTVLGYIHYDEPYVAFGRDIFKEDKKPFAFNCLNNMYNFFEGDFLLVFDGINSVALHQFKTDLMLTRNLINEKKDIVMRMENKLKAYIQQYNNRMVDNNLTPDGPQIGITKE
jgi:phosphoglycerol transferase MdoB-like AlkP superfamily enzyme